MTENSPNDELYQRYLDRAIRQINQLGDDIAGCTLIEHPAHAPVVGSGHPLADIMLLKYRAQPSEVQEGVAFYGRAGDAILKSIRRLGIDPLLVYGTNCVKCMDGHPDEAVRQCPIWLLREVAIVEPKLVVAMGEDTVDVLNELALPMRRPIDASRLGEPQELTPTIQAIVVPDIDESLNDETAKRRFWSAFKRVGDWYQALPPY
jgi:uracil-DNA glycosylase